MGRNFKQEELERHQIKLEMSIGYRGYLLKEIDELTIKLNLMKTLDLVPEIDCKLEEYVLNEKKKHLKELDFDIKFEKAFIKAYKETF